MARRGGQDLPLEQPCSSSSGLQHPPAIRNGRQFASKRVPFTDTKPLLLPLSRLKSDLVMRRSIAHSVNAPQAAALQPAVERCALPSNEDARGSELLLDRPSEDRGRLCEAGRFPGGLARALKCTSASAMPPVPPSSTGLPLRSSGGAGSLDLGLEIARGCGHCRHNEVATLDGNPFLEQQLQLQLHSVP